MISRIFLIGGAILVAVGLLQFLLLLRRARRGTMRRREQFRSSLELLRQKVDTAQAQLETGCRGPAWRGYRQFRVEKKTTENRAGVCSLALVPCDGKPLATFDPGQYLTFRFSIPGQSKPVVRCYSLSDCFCDNQYRVSIKRLPAPPGKPDVAPGLASSYFHEQMFHEAENYLHTVAYPFSEDFDANSMVYLLQTWSHFDLAVKYGSLAKALEPVKARMMVIAATGDNLFPPNLSDDLVKAAHVNNISVRYELIDEDYGHDFFLIPEIIFDKISRPLVEFLS